MSILSSRFFQSLLVPLSCFLFVASLTMAQDSRPTSRKATTQKVKVVKKTITFKSLDGLILTADLYTGHKDKKTPFILLCHQAGWSRGEYNEIAPKLVGMGFNCLAIDQRSGGGVNQVLNASVKAAQKKGLGTGFLDARQDIIAALKLARKQYAQGKLLLWGSSYSSALALQIAGTESKLADGVLSFAPGEYFKRFGKTKHYIRDAAKNIKVPTFLTGSRKESRTFVKEIADVMKLGKKLHLYQPKSKGHHGSRALWQKFDDSPGYWKALTQFLDQNFPRQTATSRKS